MGSPEVRSFEHRWDQYQQLDHLTTHWYWRPGWKPGRTFLTWHLTFEDQPALHTLVAEIQDHLSVDYVDLVPSEGLHLTVQGIGFTDEITDSETTAIVAASQQRCAAIPAFDLTLGPVDPDAEGIGLLVRPWQAVNHLRDAIRDAIAAIRTDVPENATGFRPHVTIAYTAADVPNADATARLAPLRTLPPTSVRVTAVRLIELRRNDRTYEWDTIATVRLSSAPATAAAAFRD